MQAGGGDPCAPRYVTDVDYGDYYTATLAPEWLDLVALIAGIAPPDRTGREHRWCELGCGRGVSAVVSAHAHPEGAYCGVDVMPGHIAAARRLADAAGVTNLTLVAADFADAEAGAPGPFDYIVAHGVYSWIDDAALDAFHRFVDRTLAPGGLLHVSYNAMPGWAADLPLQRLMLKLGERGEGTSDVRAEAARATVIDLARSGTGTLSYSPVARQWQSDEAVPDPRYLAHEYLAPHWRPLYVDTVRRRMRAIGLQPAGTASLDENFDRLVLGRAAREALARFDGDEDRRELVRDYMLNQRFRRDVYTRGGARLDAGEQRRRLLAMPFALLLPESLVRYEHPTHGGRIRFDNAAARAIVRRLADGQAPLSACGCEGVTDADLVANMVSLCVAGAIMPALPAPIAVERLSRALLSLTAMEGAERGNGRVALDCGVASLFSGAFLSRLLDGVPGEDDADWAQFLIRRAGVGALIGRH